MEAGPKHSMADGPGAARVARMLASPTGVLIVVPLLVISVGIVVLLLGRRATRDASDTMARRQLAAQAIDVQHDVAFALDQADSILASLRAVAIADLPFEDVAIRMHDMIVGRPGIANVSIAFPDGLMRGTYLDDKTNALSLQESRVTAHGTDRQNYNFADGKPVPTTVQNTTYDPRTRPHYTMAQAAHKRVWMPPRTFFSSHKTGMTVTEPVYAADNATLRAVITVDFDVTELSSFIVHAPLDGARTVMFSGDGSILAFPSVPLPPIASKENRLLNHADFADPALDALFVAANFTTKAADADAGTVRFYELMTADGAYLASVAPVGGKRAGIAAPLDWYLATLVPWRTLLGPTKRLEKQSLVASGGALAIAMGVALMFAWNLVRMRRQVTESRARAQTAEARAKELGSYRLVSKLGAGGMGEVWRAEHRLLARQAAIKLMRPEALADPMSAPKVRERFRREAQTLASMRSRHTIALHDYGVTDDGTFFFVMELLDGMDLDSLVRYHGAQPSARVIQLLAQACQSLAEAHEAGLLHRDIKPANLFISRAAEEVDILKVLDFGIVRAIDDLPGDPLDAVTLPTPAASGTSNAASIVTSTGGKLTQVGAVVGTPGYIPPEQAYGLPIDARSDLYALGCVAWWLLTQSEVYARPDDDTALQSHLNDPVPALRPKVHGWLPVELETLVLSLLAKEASGRPANARVLATALRAIPIPDEHAWDDNRAQAWWFVHRPLDLDAQAAATNADGERLLVPQPSGEQDAVPHNNAAAPTQGSPVVVVHESPAAAAETVQQRRSGH